MKYSVGRYVYGEAVIGSGICALVWHHYDVLAALPHREIFTYVLGTIAILAGVAVQLPKTARAGAAALGATYLIFALVGAPAIIKDPLVYNGYGNFCEQFSYVAGAMILYACSGSIAVGGTARWARIGYRAFGVCAISFALEQLFYLSSTASLVPKWIPPGQMFWAVATSVAFILAGIALLTGFMALLSSRLTAAMLLGFLLLIWLPMLFAKPHSFGNWSESMETLAIAGTAWIVADFFWQHRSGKSASANLG